MRKKVLFIHNSIAEYRIEFWKILDKKVGLDLWITQRRLADKIYGLEKDTSELNISFVNVTEFLKSRKLRKYNTVVLPPADGIKEIFVCMAVGIQCRVLKIPCYYWTEKWESDWRKQPFLKKAKNIIHRIVITVILFISKNCICSGSKAYNYVCNLGVKRKNISIAYNSSTSPKTDSINIHKKYNIPTEKTKIILYIGRIIERKGLMYLIKAFEQIRDDSYWLLICGDGEYRKRCENYVRDRKIDNVIFTGKIQPNERGSYYSASNVFVLPSFPYKGTIEGWGLVVNESLECGTPVIATKAVGAAWDLLDGYNGRMINYQSYKELVEAIVDICSGDSREKYCKDSYKKFSVEKMAEAFAKSLNQ